MSYKCISDFGQSINNVSANPLTYCMTSELNSAFNHGALGQTISGPYSQNCQSFMSSYCAENWNGICEAKSRDQTTLYPNTLQQHGTCKVNNLTAGEMLLLNTAIKKYMSKMIGPCDIRYEPFDPTVSNSPLIAIWNNTSGCIPIYEVDPEEIDSDPVMNKILEKPAIAWNLLVNIYNTAVNKNTLHLLKNTKLYKFFQSKLFQTYIAEYKQKR